MLNAIAEVESNSNQSLVEEYDDDYETVKSFNRNSGTVSHSKSDPSTYHLNQGSSRRFRLFHKPDQQHQRSSVISFLFFSRAFHTNSRSRQNDGEEQHGRRTMANTSSLGYLLGSGAQPSSRTTTNEEQYLTPQPRTPNR